MRIELTPGMTNVVRFPIERRAKPSLEVMRDIAPDSREVSLVIEAFGFEDCIDHIRDEADQDIAEYIASNVRPDPGRNVERSSRICCGRWSNVRWRPAVRRTKSCWRP